MRPSPFQTLFFLLFNSHFCRSTPLSSFLPQKNGRKSFYALFFFRTNVPCHTIICGPGLILPQYFIALFIDAFFFLTIVTNAASSSPKVFQYFFPSPRRALPQDSLFFYLQRRAFFFSLAPSRLVPILATSLSFTPLSSSLISRPLLDPNQFFLHLAVFF